MRISLEVTQGAKAGAKIPVPLPQFIVGRDPQCHLRPASPLISKRHCALLAKNGKAYVRDLNSTNGTFVNEQQVKDEVELHEADQLRLGPLVFIVRVEAAAPARKTPAPTNGAAAVKQPVAANAVEDESVAAMLMDMQDEESPVLADADGSQSTVTEMAPAAMETPPPTATIEPDSDNPFARKPKEKPVPASSGNTSAVAKQLLEKYTRRPRK